MAGSNPLRFAMQARVLEQTRRDYRLQTAVQE